MDELSIKPATLSDVPIMLEFIKELAEYEKRLSEVTATQDLLKEHLFGNAPKAEAVIAWQGTTAVGFALFFHNFSTFLGKPGLYLEDLYVRPEYRGAGIGSKLLKYLANLALERGCGRFEWWVIDWNTPAIEFYRRMGAKPMDEWTVQRVEGAALVALANSN